MLIRQSPSGVPYLAGSSEAPPHPTAKPASLLRQGLIFLAIFVLLQTCWTAASGTLVERLVIDQATVAAAAMWVRTLTPDVAAIASGATLTAPGGGINVLKGCEGTEVVFLLIAAFAVAHLSWRARLVGAAIGTMFIYALNQVRVIALFYAYRQDPVLFDQLHGTIGPLVMVVLVGSYYVFWLNRCAPRPVERDAGQAA
jgi:exosortase/archaeosortase family protein